MAHITANLVKESFDLGFSGTLHQPTLAKILTAPPLRSGVLEGDIKASGSVKGLSRWTARGSLRGRNLLIDIRDQPLRVEDIRLKADADKLAIESAALRWRNSSFALSGALVGEKNALRLDLDLRADRLDWDELKSLPASASDRAMSQTAGAAWRPWLVGTMRLKSDTFRLAGFDLRPLQLTASLTPTGMEAKITDMVVCGIQATGRVDVVEQQIGLDLRLVATKAELRPASNCLTDGQLDATGTYTLAARISGRGDQKDLLSSLKGDFEFSASDGELVRSAAADATFDYLNATGDFNMAFPDLNKESFPYRFIGIKGTLDGENLIHDELIVQSQTLTLNGQGRVALRQRQIDGKGLVSVALPGNQVIKNIPLIGPMAGGRLVGIPVRVTGSFDRPKVSYLSPADLGTELINVPLRILNAPLEALRLFTPSGAGGNNGGKGK